MKLLFNVFVSLEYVTVGFTRFRVFPYTQNPWQCTRCYRFGHFSSTCTKLDHVPAVAGTTFVLHAQPIRLVASTANENMIQYLVVAPYAKLSWNYATTKVKILLAMFPPSQRFSKETNNVQTNVVNVDKRNHARIRDMVLPSVIFLN